MHDHAEDKLDGTEAIRRLHDAAKEAATTLGKAEPGSAWHEAAQGIAESSGRTLQRRRFPHRNLEVVR